MIRVTEQWYPVSSRRYKRSHFETNTVVRHSHPCHWVWDVQECPFSLCLFEHKVNTEHPFGEKEGSTNLCCFMGVFPTAWNIISKNKHGFFWIEFGVRFHGVYADCPCQILCVFWARGERYYQLTMSPSVRWPRKTKEFNAEQDEFPPVVLHNQPLDKGRSDTGSSLYCVSRGVHSPAHNHSLKRFLFFWSRLLEHNVPAL